MSDQKKLFSIASSVAETAAIKAKGTKTVLANGVNTHFIDWSRHHNDLKKLRNSPSWLAIFSVVPFNKITPFPKDLIALMISFITLFVIIIPELEMNEIHFLIFHFDS